MKAVRTWCSQQAIPVGFTDRKKIRCPLCNRLLQIDKEIAMYTIPAHKGPYKARRQSSRVANAID